MRMLKAAALAALLTMAAAFVPVQADYVVKDGNTTLQTIKAFTCATSEICPGYTPMDMTGSAFGVAGNPFYIAPVPDVRPSSGVITAIDTGSSTASGQNGVSIITGSPSANSSISQAINGEATARVQLSGTWTGTIAFEGSVDGGTTWVPQTARVSGTGYTGASATANGLFQVDTSGLTNLRVRATASVTGTAAVIFTFANNTGIVQLSNPVRIFDNVSGNQATVDGSGRMNVNCAAGCAGGSTSNASDNVATTSTNQNVVSYLYAWNGTGFDRLQVDGSKNLKTVLQSIPNPVTAAAWGIIGAGSTTAGSLGQLGLCAVTTSAPGYTNGQNNFLSCDNSGNLRVTGTLSVTGSGDTTASLSGMTALNAATQISLAGQNSVAVLLSGTWAGTIIPEVSSDGGTTWAATSFYNVNTHTIAATVTTNGTYDIMGTGGKSQARVRISAYTSGTVTGNLLASTQAPSSNDAQAEAVVNWGYQADAACGTDNGTCSIAALLKRNNQNLTTLNTTASGPVPGVTGPLAASGSGLATFGLMGACQYLSTLPSMSNLQQVSTLCSARGEQLVTTYDTRPASGTITTQDIASSSTTGQNGAAIVTGSPTASSSYSQAINGQGSVRVVISGTWTGTLTFEGSADGTNWSVLEGRVSGVDYAQSSITGNGTFFVSTAGLANFRVRATSAMTGTVTVAASFAADPGVVQIANPLRLFDNATGAEATVKPANSPATMGNTGLVVESRPCLPYHLSGGTTASNNANVIKASAGSICRLTLINTNTSTLGYLKVYDSASSPTCSSATNLKHIYPILGGPGGVQSLDLAGEAYANGIAYCVTGGGGDTDNTNAPTGIYIEASDK